MLTLLQQAALALGMGGIVALAGQGIVQIYRGSGVLNFAHGSFALAAAQVFAWAWADHGWPPAIALGLALLCGAVLGLLTHLFVMRPLRSASQLVRIIATIGLMQVVQQGTGMIFGNEPRSVGSFLPSGAVELGSVSLPKAGLVICSVAIGTTVLLVVVMNLSRFGLSTRAVAQSELVSRSLGHSPDVIAAINWTIGGVLAALAGVFVVPIGGVAIGSILLLAVPAFAAAVIGGFQSFFATTVGAIVIAGGQAVLTFQSVAHGWPASLPASLPFLVVVLVLVLRSTSLPTRDHLAAHLPRLGQAKPPRLAGVVVAAAAGLALLAPVDLANALITTALTAIVGLSLVVCTGLVGQISLAQYAIAGVGGLVAARLSSSAGWPFLLCVAAGAVAASAAGAVFALPAIRTRGPALAVVTIGLGLAVQQGILADKDITGGFNGSTPVERPTVMGLAIDATRHPSRYAAFCVLVLGGLGLATAGLARSSVGRRMIAIRNHERVSASMGIAVAGVKVYGFALSSLIAGAGGALMAFRFDSVQYSQYSFAASLQIVTLVLIGGVGFVAGPLIGAIGVPAGVAAWALSGVGDAEHWLLLGSGVLLIVTLVGQPDGVAGTVRRSRPAVADQKGLDAPAPTETEFRPAPLVVESATVHFGGFVALDDVTLEVRPGRVTGLIGANGAGKTTLIDAVSGFVPLVGGTVAIGRHDITRSSPAARARLGVARCFQSIDLFHDLTVQQNLLVGTEQPTALDMVVGFVRSRDEALPPAARWIVGQLGLDDLVGRSPSALSHGQRRLVGVARALVGRPAVLLLDEPAAGLDRSETDRLGEVIRQVASMGIGVLLVEHDVDLVMRVSDHVVAIDAGRTIFSGSPRDALSDRRVRSAYLGEPESKSPGATTLAAHDTEAMWA